MVELMWGLAAIAIGLFVVYKVIEAIFNASMLNMLTLESKELGSDLYLWLNSKSTVTKEEVLEFLASWEK